MTCSAYWAKQVESRITRHWPDLVVVQTRSYGTTRHIEGLGVLPPVERDNPGDPIKQMVRYLKTHHTPKAIMYNPRGGFSVAN